MLSGRVDVMISNQNRSAARSQGAAGFAGAAPASGDAARFEATLNRPAYIYLVLVDAEGDVTPVYPGSRAAGMSGGPSVRSLGSLPRGAQRVLAGHGHIGDGDRRAPGRETPLPEGQDLSALFVGLESQPLLDGARMVELENGRLLNGGEQQKGDRRSEPST